MRLQTMARSRVTSPLETPKGMPGARLPCRRQRRCEGEPAGGFQTGRQKRTPAAHGGSLGQRSPGSGWPEGQHYVRGMTLVGWPEGQHYVATSSEEYAISTKYVVPAFRPAKHVAADVRSADLQVGHARSRPRT